MGHRRVLTARRLTQIPSSVRPRAPKTGFFHAKTLGIRYPSFTSTSGCASSLTPQDAPSLARRDDVPAQMPPGIALSQPQDPIDRRPTMGDLRQPLADESVQPFILTSVNVTAKTLEPGPLLLPQPPPAANLHTLPRTSSAGSPLVQCLTNAFTYAGLVPYWKYGHWEAGAMRRMSLEVLPEEAQELQRRVRSHTVAVRDRQRARIILLAVEGLDQKAIAAKLGTTRASVGQWCRRYRQRSLAGLADAPGRGRKPRLSQAKVRRVLETVGKPPAHLGRWSCRTMACRRGHLEGECAAAVGGQ